MHGFGNLETGVAESLGALRVRGDVAQRQALVRGGEDVHHRGKRYRTDPSRPLRRIRDRPTHLVPIRRSTRWASRKLTYLASAHTALGTIYLLEREILSQPGTMVLELFFDHALLMSSLNTHSERALARHAIEMHGGRDLRVLVGGLGLGYTAREVLDSEAVASLEVIEFLPELIDWFERGVIPLGPRAPRRSALLAAPGRRLPDARRSRRRRAATT